MLEEPFLRKVLSSRKGRKLIHSFIKEAVVTIHININMCRTGLPTQRLRGNLMSTATHQGNWLLRASASKASDVVLHENKQTIILCKCSMEHKQHAQRAHAPNAMHRAKTNIKRKKL